MLSVLDVAVAQQVLLHGDLTAEFVLDRAWDAQANLPRQEASDTQPLDRDAIRLLRNNHNPWLARNVLMLVLDRSLRMNGPGLDPSQPYATAIAPFFQIKDPAGPDNADRQLLRAGDFYLRGLFNLPSSTRFEIRDETVADQTTRRLYLSLNDLSIEMPSVPEFRDRTLGLVEVHRELMTAEQR
jgi:hypothetical protein